MAGFDRMEPMIPRLTHFAINSRGQNPHGKVHETEGRATSSPSKTPAATRPSPWSTTVSPNLPSRRPSGGPLHPKVDRPHNGLSTPQVTRLAQGAVVARSELDSGVTDDVDRGPQEESGDADANDHVGPDAV